MFSPFPDIEERSGLADRAWRFSRNWGQADWIVIPVPQQQIICRARRDAAG